MLTIPRLYNLMARDTSPKFAKPQFGEYFNDIDHTLNLAFEK
jgi:hypothetical protein